MIVRKTHQRIRRLMINSSSFTTKQNRRTSRWFQNYYYLAYCFAFLELRIHHRRDLNKSQGKGLFIKKFLKNSSFSSTQLSSLKECCGSFQSSFFIEKDRWVEVNKTQIQEHNITVDEPSSKIKWSFHEKGKVSKSLASHYSSAKIVIRFVS